jgi:hypothetical protein
MSTNERRDSARNTGGNVDSPVIYHGIREAAGTSAVLVETIAGEALGVLAHKPRHSPTGFQWGYAGSGPADLARCLLLAAVGGEGHCPTCGGTGRVATDAKGTELPATPDSDPEAVMGCMACDEGSLVHPAMYQQYKFDVVAGLGSEWRLRQDDVVAWWRRYRTTTQQQERS